MRTDYKRTGENREGLAASDRSEPGENPAEFGNGTGPPPNRADLFLSPHSDDVCFSLGDLARRRQAGTLFTIFSRSQYVAIPRTSVNGSADEITAERLAEDEAFASACGLITESLGLRDAPMRGRLPFALENLAIEAQALEPVLFDQILFLAGRRKPADRPWLFCPSGIGGHIDHVAVMTVVARNIDMLQQIYRVCFYEDLHYASNILARSTGLHRLAQNLPEHTFIRRQWRIAEAEKLNLIRLYASQFPVLPTSVEQFIPAIYLGQVPHEAVWTVQRRKR